MDYIGKLVLIGISLFNKDGNISKKQQVAGRVLSVSEKCIVIEKLDDREKFNLPPFLEGFQSASPGMYRLKNGNVDFVSDPDYLICWNIYPSEEASNPQIFKAGYQP